MNNRVHWACHALQIADTVMHGVQDMSIDTSFTLEQFFQLGQSEVYDNAEGLPAIELTASKVLDGDDLIFLTGTPGGSGLISRSNQTCDVMAYVYSDDVEFVEGNSIQSVVMSGMYVQTVTYTIPVNGGATESVTFVGNDKVRGGVDSVTGEFGNDTPEFAGGVLRRQHVLMGPSGSVWPNSLQGIVNGVNEEVGDSFAAHIQDVTISVNFGREDLLELGRRKPYFRYSTLPIPVETTISVTAGGTDPTDNVDAYSNQDNLTDEEIVIMLEDGTILDCGTRNKLQRVSQTGGDTGGGVVTISYSYQNFNTLNITGPS
jgi:hypothetical protein